MSIGISVRRGTPVDAHALAVLRYDFRAEVAADSAGRMEERQEFIERCARWMTDALAGNTWCCWIAERPQPSGSEMIGSIWLEVVEKVPNPVVESERHGYVTNLFVRAAARSAGAGSALLTALIVDAQQLDLDSLFLWPTERSRSLYERNGFSAGAVVARRL